MKKKLISLLLTAAMAASMLTGCGSGESNKAGAVLNIYVWNEEFKDRVTEFYPGYEKVDDVTGKIGDVKVKWNITPNADNQYQNNLDAALTNQEKAKNSEKIDIFLVEADYALKYVDSNYTMAVADLGITDAELANQYQYTKDIVTDSNGVLKGLSWQGCPGIMFYNRDIAKEVLGTEDPDAVQAYVKDWATFNETAKLMKEAGYYMTATVMDTYRVYSNNVSSKWVVDGKINIDQNILNWVDDTKALYDAGMTQNAGLWSDEWSAGFYPPSDKFPGAFCYFGPAWMINFSMAADVEGSVGHSGRWGGTVGPQGFFWGGTWICAATGTDNQELVADIMRQLTTNKDIMVDIVEKKDDFVNNVPAMEEMANSAYTSTILGGMNPLGMYAEGAKSIDLSNLSAYDQGCNEEFQNAMKDYFAGTYATVDDAIAAFKTAIGEKYPELAQ